MRNMSFSMTVEQIRNRTKIVTRRLGWKFLQPGQLIRAVKKSMGLKQGQKVEELAILRILSVRRERLDRLLRDGPSLNLGYGMSEVEKEGLAYHPRVWGSPMAFIEWLISW